MEEKENLLNDIHTQFVNTEVCNSFIKEAFLPYLLKIDYRKVDLQDFFIINNDGCSFEIKSLKKDNLNLFFDFWKSQVNIYLGDKQVHSADDAEVRNDKEQMKFQEELYAIFNSSIIEEVSQKNYGLLFKHRNGTIVKRINSKKNSALLLEYKEPSKKIYEPRL